MEIKEIYSIDDKEYWLDQMKKSDWAAGQFLHELLSNNELKKLCGETTKVFLLTDGEQLISSKKQLEIDMGVGKGGN